VGSLIMELVLTIKSRDNILVPLSGRIESSFIHPLFGKLTPNPILAIFHGDSTEGRIPSSTFDDPLL
jgi:hypothetical protein